jgi:uncharacterized protein YneF (UPF0154 family)
MICFEIGATKGFETEGLRYVSSRLMIDEETKNPRINIQLVL